jgi:hypothetical protein
MVQKLHLKRFPPSIYFYIFKIATTTKIFSNAFLSPNMPKIRFPKDIYIFASRLISLPKMNLQKID